MPLPPVLLFLLQCSAMPPQSRRNQGAQGTATADLLAMTPEALRERWPVNPLPQVAVALNARQRMLGQLAASHPGGLGGGSGRCSSGAAACFLQAAPAGPSAYACAPPLVLSSHAASIVTGLTMYSVGQRPEELAAPAPGGLRMISGQQGGSAAVPPHLVVRDPSGMELNMALPPSDGLLLKPGMYADGGGTTIALGAGGSYMVADLQVWMPCTSVRASDCRRLAPEPSELSLDRFSCSPNCPLPALQPKYPDRACCNCGMVGIRFQLSGRCRAARYWWVGRGSPCMPACPCRFEAHVRIDALPPLRRSNEKCERWRWKHGGHKEACCPSKPAAEPTAGEQESGASDEGGQRAG